MTPPSEEELRAAHCWEAEDRVPGRPAMTGYRRALRLHHARWREAVGHPIGTQPIAPKTGAAARPVGSQLPLEYGRETGATFLTPAALGAARHRTSFVEAHQSFDHQRLWADLLSSAALAFNLFGDLAADPVLADGALQRWLPGVPGRVHEVRFAHSPGRLDPAYLNSLRDVAAAFVLDLDDGTSGFVAVDVKYHERTKAETPRPDNLARYTDVARRSGAFTRGSIDVLAARSDLCVMWLEHLLVLSMLQHGSRDWTWCRYVVVHPPDNLDMTDACTRYRALLADDATFATITLEQVLDNAALPSATVHAVRERYVA